PGTQAIASERPRHQICRPQPTRLCSSSLQPNPAVVRAANPRAVRQIPSSDAPPGDLAHSEKEHAEVNVLVARHAHSAMTAASKPIQPAGDRGRELAPRARRPWKHDRP